MNHGQPLGQERKSEPLRRKQAFPGARTDLYMVLPIRGPAVRTGHPGAVGLAVGAQHGLAHGHC